MLTFRFHIKKVLTVSFLAPKTKFSSLKKKKKHFFEKDPVPSLLSSLTFVPTVRAQLASHGVCARTNHPREIRCEGVHTEARARLRRRRTQLRVTPHGGHQGDGSARTNSRSLRAAACVVRAIFACIQASQYKRLGNNMFL